jgi:L-rhamnose isomerase / sugar isomerase
MIQTVVQAQALYAKAALVDCASLAAAQQATDLVRAESCLQDAFACDVRPAIREWRTARGVPADPMDAFRESGYLERITKERAGRPVRDASAYA